MTSEQEGRFESVRQMVAAAEQALVSLRQLTDENLRWEEDDNPAQGEALQRVQQTAGDVAKTMEAVAETTRRARSHQAQAHHEKHS